ncbi:hypothetical protein C0J52_27049 [Blattella germanica]|nr:hypothetical protein C0J52_27049 [Blattella germanica]
MGRLLQDRRHDQRGLEGTKLRPKTPVTRYAEHGFHHLICKEKRHHEPSDKCVCELYGTQCSRYHVDVCKERTVSMKKICCGD